MSPFPDLCEIDRLHNHAGELAKLKFGTPQMQHDVACTLTRRVSLVVLKTHACSTSMAILNHVSADKVFNQPYKKNIPGFCKVVIIVVLLARWC